MGALSRTKRDLIHRYTLDGYLLLYLVNQFDAPRTVIFNDMDLRALIIREYYNVLVGGHSGSE